MKFLIIFLLVISCKSTQKDESELLSKAKAIQEKILVLDSHIDININNFTDEKNYTQKLDNQFNLPYMEEGGVDVAWLIVKTSQEDLTKEGYEKAYKKAMNKLEAIHKLAKDIAPDRFGLAFTANEVKDIYASGKKVIMIGVENAYPLGTDISRVKQFYDLGARYMTISHNGHNQFSDSHTGEKENIWLHNGVSNLGKEVVKEMNKMGIMIDISHSSKKSMKDIIELTKAPIIASHSSARALCNHSRNLDNEQLEWIKENNGVVQTVAVSYYINKEKLETETSFYMKLSKRINSLISPVNVSDFVDHIDYIVQKIGINHVGISSDFDGGGGVDGWNDASETLNVTIELVKRGYTEEQIAKLWSGNLLRVLDDVERIAKEIQAEENS